MLLSVRKPKHSLLRGLLLSLVTFISLKSFAQSGPANFNVSGALFLPSGAAVTNASVNFKLEVWDPGGTCLLYSEEHPAQNLSQTKGGFSLQVGAGSNKNNYVESSAVMTSKIFENNGVLAGGWLNCPVGPNLVSGDERMIRVYYDLGGGFTAMTPDVPIVSAAYSMVAETLQGKRPEDFIQVKDDMATDLTQSNVETIFSSTNYTRLLTLLSSSGSFSFGNQRLTNLADPTAAQDGATKNYADTRLAGQTIDLVNVGMGTGGGKVLTWDQAQNKWVALAPSTTDNTKLPLDGTGTMTGALQMGGQNITNTGHITMAAQKVINLGTFDNAQEAALVATLLPANEGAFWYNSQDNVVKVWNGTAAITQGATGAAGGDLTGTYPNPDIAALAVGTAEIAANAVTTAKIADGAITTPKLFANPGVGRLVMTDITDGSTLVPIACAVNEVLKWQATGWTCATVASLSPVQTVEGRTGNIDIEAADISDLGTAALRMVGTSAGNVVEVLAGGKLPVLDGSNLTAVNAVKLQGRDVAATAPNNNEVLSWNGTAWAPVAIPSAPVTSVSTKTGAVVLDWGDIGNAATKYMTYAPNNVACANNEVLKWDGSKWICGDNDGFSGKAAGGDLTGTYPNPTIANNAVVNAYISNGAVSTTKLFANPGVGRLVVTDATDGSTLAPLACAPDEILKWSASTGWGCATAASLVAGSNFAQNGNSFGATAVLGTNDTQSLQFETDGTAKMTILANGNVGIGTATPSYVLDVTGNARASGNLIVGSNGTFGGAITAPQLYGGTGVASTLRLYSTLASGTTDYIALHTGNSVERMRIDTTGKVGIGTTNPLWPLDVTGSIHSSARFIGVGLSGVAPSPFAPLLSQNTGGAVDEKYWDFYHSATAFGLRALDDAYSTSNTALQFNRSGYTITSSVFPSGNVGIGTGSPGAKLHVAGSMRLDATALPGTPAAGDIVVDSGASNSLKWYNGTSWQTVATTAGLPTADSLDFSELKDAMLLDASTDISATGTNVLSVTNSGTGNSFVVNDQAADASPFVIDAAGSVGIGTTTPGMPLDVNGNMRASGYFVNSNTTGMHWGADDSIVGHAGAHYVAVNTNGGERLRVDSAGNVGIGTTTPNQLLTVEGPMSLRTQAAPTATANYGKLYVDSGDSDKLKYMNPAGSIVDLSAVGSLPAADSLDFTEFKDAMALDASTDISATGTNVLSITNSGTGNSFVVNDQAADTSPFVIDAVGRAGVGIAAPTSGLHVVAPVANETMFTLAPNSGTAGASTLTVDAYGNLETGGNVKGQGIGFQWDSGLGEGVIGNGNNDLTITTNVGSGTSTRNILFKTKGGNVGIGTTTPGSILHVSSGSAWPAITMQGGTAADGVNGITQVNDSGYEYSIGLTGSTNAPIGANTFFIWNDATSATPFVIKPSGNIGIGTVTPGRLLHVGGPIRVDAAALPGTPAVGDIAIDSGANNTLKWHNGTSWQTVATHPGGSGYALAGANSDITSMSAVTAITSTGNLSLSSAAGAFGATLQGGTGGAAVTANGNVTLSSSAANGNIIVTPGATSGQMNFGSASTGNSTFGNTGAGSITTITGGSGGTGKTTVTSPATGAGAVTISTTGGTTATTLITSNGTGTDSVNITSTGVNGGITLAPNGTGYVTSTKPITITPAALPGTTAAGMIAIDSTGNVLKWHNGTSWMTVGTGGGDFMKDGSVAMTGNLTHTGGTFSILQATGQTVFLGNTAGTSTTTINSGTGGININNNGSSTGNITMNPGSASGTVTIGNATSTGATVLGNAGAGATTTIQSGSGAGARLTLTSASSDTDAIRLETATNNGGITLAPHGTGVVTSTKPIIVSATALPTGSAGMIAVDSGANNSLKWHNGTSWQTIATTAGLPSGDSLDFSEFKDAMALDASTDISVTGTNVLSVTNTGSGHSLLVNDQAGDTSPFVIDASGNVGVGTASPTAALSVIGSADVVQALIKGNATQSGDVFQVKDSSNVNLFKVDPYGNAHLNLQLTVGASATIGSPTPGNARLSLVGSGGYNSWTTTGTGINVGGTFIDNNGSGTIANRVGSSFASPTFTSANPVTLTKASTLYVGGAPTAGANTTISNGLALEVATGTSSFGGNVGIGTSSPNQLLTVEGPMSLRTQAAPTATANYGKIYVDSGDSNKLKYMNPAGTITDLTAAGGAPTADSLDFTHFADSMTLDASTVINATGTNVLSINNTGTGNSFVVNDEASDTTPFVIDASGNVGMGGNLALDTDKKIFFETTEANGWLMGRYDGAGNGPFTSSLVTQSVLALGIPNVTNNEGFAIGRVGGNSILEINQNGTSYFRENLGIGTTTPNQLLTVEGPMSLRTQAAPTATANYGKLYVDSGDSNKLKYMNPAGTITDLTAAGGSPAADSLDFTHFADAMTLDVSTDIAVTGTNVLSVTNSGTGASFRVNDAAGDTTPFIITGAGTVAIGTTTPDSTGLHVKVNPGAHERVVTIGGDEATPPNSNGTYLSINGTLGNGASLITANSGTGRVFNLNDQGFIRAGVGQGSGVDTNTQYVFGGNGVSIGGNAAINTAFTTYWGEMGVSLGYDTTAKIGVIAGHSDSGGSQLAMYTKNSGGTQNERLRIDTAGNVGIGTTSPNQLLTVEGPMSLRTQAAPTATANYGKIYVDSGDSDKLKYMNPAGTITDLSAAGGTPAADSLDFTEFKDALALDASTDIAVSGTNVLSVTNSGTGSSFRINDQAADTTPFLIDDTGNVAIGTTTPFTNLTVDGGATAPATPVILVKSNNGGIGFGAYAGSTNLANAAGAVIGHINVFSGESNGQASHLAFHTNHRTGANTYTGMLERMRLTSDGQLGIGTQSPNQLLTVEGPASLRAAAAPTATANYGKIYVDSGDSNKLKYMNPAGTITDLSAAGGTPAADSLDFTEFKDALALDASTDISVTGTNVLSVTNSGTGASFRVNDQAADTSPFIIDAAGNVGIGTATPAQNLDIVGNGGDIGARFQNTNNAGWANNQFVNNLGSRGWIGVGGSATGVQEANRLFLSNQDTAGITFDLGGSGDLRTYVGGTELMRVTNSGNVGIGTTSPNQKLTVEGPMSLRTQAAPTATANYGKIYVDSGDSNKLKYMNPAGTITDLSAAGGTPSANSLDFTEFKDAMALDASTDIAVDNAEVLSITNTGTGHSFRVNDQATDVTPFIIDASGNVGIGTSTANSALHVKGVSGDVTSLGVMRFESNNGTNDTGAKIGAIAGAGSIGYAFIQGIHVGVGNDANLILNPGGANVGIGTTSPNQLLTVEGPMSLRTQAAPTATANYGKLYVDSGDSNKLKYMNPAGTITDLTAGGGSSQWTTSGSNIYFNTGHVGIGTTTPATINGLDYSAAAKVVHISSGTVYSSLAMTGVGGSALSLVDSSAAADQKAFSFSAGAGNVWINNVTDAGASRPMLRVGVTNENISLGQMALASVTTGSTNIAIGAAALQAANGSNNVAIGKFSQINNSGGNDNVTLGNGTFGVGSTGSSNTAVGHGALGAVTGNGNVVVGYLAGDNITSGGRNIVIGSDIDAPSATTSNQLNIGNIIFGTGLTGTGTTIAGSIGIGTSSPNQLLTIEGPMSLRTQAAPTATANYGKLYVDSGDSNKLKYMNPAGTITDLTAGGTPAADSLDFTEFKDALALDASTDIAVDNAEVFSITNTGTGNSFVVNDQATDTTPFVIDASGNVGVGTTSPSTLLHIKKDQNAVTSLTVANATNGAAAEAQVFVSNNNADYLVYGMYATGHTGGNFLQAGGAYTQTSSPWGLAIAATNAGGTLRFGTGGTADANERMRIDQTGKVGIGTTSPSTTLTVQSGTGGILALRGNDPAAAVSAPYMNAAVSSGFSSTVPVYSFWYQSTTGITNPADSQLAIMTAGTERIRFDNSGNVGIGTTSPAEKLHVNGNVQAVNYFYTSDRRLKTDIRPVEGLELIERLNGVRFNWIENGKAEVGLIAQDVEQVLPELVNTNPHNGMKAVKYGNLVAPLIQATKELHGMCKMSDAQLKALGERVGQVERKLASQESAVSAHDAKIKALEEKLKALEVENKELKSTVREIHQMLRQRAK